MRRMRAAGRLAGGAAALAGGVVVVLATVDGSLAAPPADPGAWAEWLAVRPPEVTAMAVVRLLAVVAAGYLALLGVVAVLAGAVGAGRVVAALELTAVPGARPLVRAAAATGLALATMTPGAVASAVTGADDPPVLQPLDDAAGEEPAPPGPSAAATPVETPPPATVAARTWEVRPGDHLWAIAERSLAAAWGRPPTDAEIAPYWRVVIDANRDRLADPGNPDLIFPGQVLIVPPVPSST